MYFWIYLVANILLCITLIFDTTLVIITKRNIEYSNWECEQKNSFKLFKIQEGLWGITIVLFLVTIILFLTNNLLPSYILYFLAIIIMFVQDIIKLVRFLKFYNNSTKTKEESKKADEPYHEVQ